MEASLFSSVLATLPSSKPSLPFGVRVAENQKPRVSLICAKRCKTLIGSRGRTFRISAISDISVAADPAASQITWQIVVGAVAGVIPFVVAGIEFSKRIIAQRRCEMCGGSGLVLRDKYNFRCPGCGGFLPWQSWRRFFSG